MELGTQIISVKLDNGAIIRIQATPVVETSTGQTELGEEVESDVSLNIRPLKEVADAITGIAESIKGAIDAVKPTKASVEFGIEFGYEAGQLTAVIVKGSGKANLKISLEWVKSD